MEHNVLESILDGSMNPTDLPLSLLEKITDNFSEERKIGEGGFAEVYKGVLQNGEVAAKRIRNYQTIHETLFRREVNNLMRVNHQNIVRFLGFCSNTVHKAVEQQGKYIYAEKRERVLCFEYINNGSLDKYITDELRGLEWNIRYNIIKGICKGLEHLHMDRGILHMDLKPANILLDNDMTAKITDFGLSRMDENSRTTSANRFISQGYCAPEYLDGGKISPKCDVYSLGVIIIELVTGHRGTSDINKALRRWRHRWNKSGQGTPSRYRQVAKLIEIGLLCKEFDPYKRPFISKIICDISELENTDSNIDEFAFQQISPYPDNDMLGIEPLELYFPFELNKQTSCSVELMNETNAYIAFCIKTTIHLRYYIEPSKGIVVPRSKYIINITLQPLGKPPQDKRHIGDFIVQSTKLSEDLTSENITEDMFKEHVGKVVDEVNLQVVAHEPLESHVDLQPESLKVTGIGTINNLQASNVPTRAESKTSLSAPDELIQFDPPELRFPFLPKHRVHNVCFVKMVNVTDHCVGFNMWMRKTNSAWYYTRPTPLTGIMPPRSTQTIIIRAVPKEKKTDDMQYNDDIIGLWNGIVSEGVEAADLSGCGNDDESKLFPVVFTTTSLSAPNELIQFDPPELRFPFLPKHRVHNVCFVKMVNVTDHYVGFNMWKRKTNSAWYYTTPRTGIMPPRSTQTITIRAVPKEKKLEDMHYNDEIIGLWNGIVTEGVEAADFSGCMNDDESKLFPIVFTTTSLSAPDELIKFDPPELRFPFLPKLRVHNVCFVKMVNVTDHCVGFNVWLKNKNSVLYYTTPDIGIMPPRSTQTIIIRAVPKEKKPEDMQYNDEIIGLWNGIVTEGVEAADLSGCMNEDESKLFPIVFTTD